MFDLFTFGDRFQVGEGYFVLLFNPFGDLARFTNVIFQPAVRIGDIGAVVVIHLSYLVTRRIASCECFRLYVR